MIEMHPTNSENTPAFDLVGRDAVVGELTIVKGLLDILNSQGGVYIITPSAIFIVKKLLLAQFKANLEWLREDDGK